MVHLLHRLYGVDAPVCEGTLTMFTYFVGGRAIGHTKSDPTIFGSGEWKYVYNILGVKVLEVAI